jgi:hypothetical protein
MAHDSWTNGEPVPAGIKAGCCGRADSHIIPASMVSRDGNGDWHVEGYPQTIPNAKVLPSPDGKYWLFARQYPDGTFTDAYCWFIPMSF